MTERDDTRRLSPLLFALGAACLVVSVVAAAVLAGQHLHLFSAPGCGDDSPCEAAASSVWGRVPGLGWPTSFVGLAYFVALLTAWVACRRVGVPRGLRILVWTGAAASVGLLVAMITGGYACVYCVVAHVGNFGFLLALELAPMSAAGTRRALAAAAAAFVLVTGAEVTGQAVAGARGRAELAGSTEQMIERARAPEAVTTGAEGGGFTSRYRLGPEDAAIRIVIISDYQCPDCRLFEQQARQILARRDDVSLSAKHHPFSTDCNARVRSNRHPNACWAARAAETAGLLYGNDGFWKMHQWLFDRGGGFTRDELVAGLRQLGFDPVEFQRVMQGTEVLALLEQDIEETGRLGLYRTPMIFVNGVELRGWWSRPNALVEAVDALAATNPPPGSPALDRPPLAREKYLGDWAASALFSFAPDPRARTIGPADAAVRLTVWGDLSEPNTAAVDASARETVAARGDTAYTFRHYPLSKGCNPALPEDSLVERPQSCRASRAAEAAGQLGGGDAYWAMQQWLLDRAGETLTDEQLRDAAASTGVDPGALLERMASVEVAREIAADAMAGKKINITSVPLIFVNNRHVQRWRHEGRSLIPDIAALAAEGR